MGRLIFSRIIEFLTKLIFLERINVASPDYIYVVLYMVALNIYILL